MQRLSGTCNCGLQAHIVLVVHVLSQQVAYNVRRNALPFHFVAIRQNHFGSADLQTVNTPILSTPNSFAK